MGNYVGLGLRARGLRNGNYRGLRGVDMVVGWWMVLMVCVHALEGLDC